MSIKLTQLYLYECHHFLLKHGANFPIVEIDDLRMSIDGDSTNPYAEGDDTLLSPTGLSNAPLLPGEQPGEEKKKRKRNVVGLGKKSLL